MKAKASLSCSSSPKKSVNKTTLIQVYGKTYKLNDVMQRGKRVNLVCMWDLALVWSCNIYLAQLESTGKLNLHYVRSVICNDSCSLRSKVRIHLVSIEHVFFCIHPPPGLLPVLGLLERYIALQLGRWNCFSVGHSRTRRLAFLSHLP